MDNNDLAGEVDTVIIGCSSPAEVRASLAVARSFEAMSPAEKATLEQRIAPRAARYDYYKAD